MTGETIGAASAAYRKKRIKRIKKIIIGTVITLLVLPILISIFLLVKVYSLEKEIQKISEDKARIQKEQEADVVKAKERDVTPTAVPEKKKVYLTFDDGPGVQTEKILNILKKQKVKATFFVTGKEGAEAKKLYRRIVAEGHTLGMHSYSHIYDTIYESKKAFQKDFEKLYEYLHDVTGVYPELYRFPGGSSIQSIELPIQTFVDVLEEKDVQYLDWNIISPDINDLSVTKKQMVNSIIQGVAQYNTSVVLMYDVADKPMTVKALPSIIKELKAENYELLPAGKEMTLIQHSHGNQEDAK